MAWASSTSSLRLSKRCSESENVNASSRASRLRVADWVELMCAREGSSVDALT